MAETSFTFRDANIKILLAVFLIWRVFLFFVVGVSGMQLPYRPGYEYTSITYWSKNAFFKDFPALSSAANFDGVHYLTIAGGHYDGEARFFPVFPQSIQLVADGIGAGKGGITPQLFGIGLVLSNMFFAATIVLFYTLLKKDFSAKIALWSTLFLIFFPTSFFFGSVYSESLFLLLVLLSFWSAREKKWWLAGCCGLLAAGTRLVGVLIFPALLFEFSQQERKLAHRDVLKKIWPLFLVPFGLLSYAWFNELKWGNWLFFLQSQGDLGNSRSVNMVVNPLQTLWRYGHILLVLSPVQYEWSVAVLELVAVSGGGALLFLSWQKKIRPSYLIFSVLVFALPIFSGTFSGMPRYVLIAFPIFVTLGSIQNTRLKIALLSVFAILLCVLTALFSRGYYVA